jgi:5'-3' exonuclease
VYILKASFADVPSVLLSASDEPGEGEHKLFAHLREYGEKLQGNVVVYGLDADLIMLSLLHLRYAENVWIFREAVHFDNDMNKETSECLHMDIRKLAYCILKEMNVSGWDQRYIDDYVFLCFFLGNDFLPHFPCLNIRTHGMPSLLMKYREVLKNAVHLVDGATGEIYWNVLQKWLASCAMMETEWFKQEREVRDKMAKAVWKQQNVEMIDQVPILFRGEEFYIDAAETVGWQERYYRVLFSFGGGGGTTTASTEIDNVCREYYRGLLWVWKYYTCGCPSWKWRYPHTYAPLMMDLYNYSVKNREVVSFCEGGMGSGSGSGTAVDAPLHPYVQLAYVLPRQNHAALIDDPLFVQWLGDHYRDLFVDNLRDFHWSYCRYFWEAHPKLPKITEDVIHKWSLRVGGVA